MTAVYNGTCLVDPCDRIWTAADVPLARTKSVRHCMGNIYKASRFEYDNFMDHGLIAVTDR
jgi:hypothetical protein